MNQRLEYPLTRGDLAEYMRWLGGASPGSRRFRLGATLIMTVVSLFAAGVLVLAGEPFHAVGILVFGLVLIGIGLTVFRFGRPWYWAMVGRMTPDTLLTRPFALQLTDEGLWSESPMGMATVYYEAVDRIVETDTHAFILLDHGTGQTDVLPRNWIQGRIPDAFILPRDRLDPDAMMAFLAELRWQCAAAIQARKNHAQ